MQSVVRRVVPVLVAVVCVAPSPLAWAQAPEEPRVVEPVRTWDGHQGPGICVAFHPQGKLLAAGIGYPDVGVRMWDLATGKPAGSPGGKFYGRGIAFSPDGRWLATGTTRGNVQVWELDSGKDPLVLEAKSDMLLSLAFSPDGSRLAAAHWANRVILWDIPSGAKALAFSPATRTASSIAWSPDGKMLVACGMESGVRLFDADGRPIGPCDGSEGTNYAARFSPDGKLVAGGSYGGSVGLWNVADRTRRATLGGHVDRVFSVSFSPDGRLVASGSKDGTVRLWDVAAERCVAVLKGHAGPVNSVAFSPTGATLASACDDKTVKLWEVDPGR